MLKIKELLKELQVLVETQKMINKSLKELNENVINRNQELNSTFVTVGKLNNAIQTNIYTKAQTIETIDKEIDYKKKYEECKNNNPDLLEFIQKYCRYDNKYQVLEIFDKIDKDYIVSKC